MITMQHPPRAETRRTPRLAALARGAPWLLFLAVLFAAILRTDSAHAGRVAKLSAEGSAPPAIDAHSPTGYALGQRHFLGTHERGETFRWIAATQHVLAEGPLAAKPASDNVPLARVEPGPRLYTAWLSAVAWAIHAVTDEPVALAAERVALWEPVLTHLLAFGAAVWLGWIRFGPRGAAVLGLVFALFPPVLVQFLPGVLGPRTWALLFAGAALLPRRTDAGSLPSPAPVSPAGAVLTALALWLAPSIGFPVVLIAALSGAVAVAVGQARVPFLTWSGLGAAVTVAAWLIDRSPWDLSAGELRYVHPLYAFAWLGLGLALDGWQRARAGGARRLWPVLGITGGTVLFAGFASVQWQHGYSGWLYPTAALRRLSSLDETRVFAHAGEWLMHAPGAETLLVLAPVLAALALLGVSWQRARQEGAASRLDLALAGVPWLIVVGFALVQVRLWVLAVLLAVPLILALLERLPIAVRRAAALAAGACLLVLILGEGRLPTTLRRSADAVEPGPRDVQALVDRHLSRWMATHHAAGSVAALAPPELSDSLVFHGGCRVLMSTAWESYSGQVAASRILSAPEASEAEAVLESRGITHIILPSWDRVLPLLVRPPLEPEKTTLFARLNQWKLPPYLRPMPYHLPPAPGYAGQTMVILKVVPPQDEALLLSRLAEYFVEMNRSEPAALAAKVLAEAYADEPNAVLARAMAHAHARDKAAFDRELERVVREVQAGRVPMDWDRRVVRALILGLGRRDDLARRELEACLAEMSPASLEDLTPLQVFRLGTLLRRYGLVFPDDALAARAASLSSEYSRPETAPPTR